MLPQVLMPALALLAGIAASLALLGLDRTRFQVRGIVGPYFAALALLFGLFASLTAGDIWQRIGRANTLVATEVSSLRSLLRIGEAIGPEGAAVADIVRRYVAEVEAAEFHADAPREGLVQPLGALRDLYRFGVDPSRFGGRAPVQSEFLRAVEQVRASHVERIEARQVHLARVKLFIVFAFGLLTQVAIALCHAGNARATWWSVMLFSVAFAVCMGVLSWLDDPRHFGTLVSDRLFADVR